MSSSESDAAQALLRSGRVDEALAALQSAVRTAPTNTQLRVFLAQLLMVNGAWERALGQLQAAAQIAPECLPMAQTYRLAIGAEAYRARVMAGERIAPVFGEPEPWMANLLRLEASMATSAAADTAVTELLAVLEDAPQRGGTVDGESFEWLGDSDMRYGPMFEMIINGRYFWVPGMRIRRMVFEPVTDLRDLVWRAGNVEWLNGGEAAFLMPARYPGVEREDAAHRLARATAFVEFAPGAWRGVGQRMFATENAEYAILDVTAIEFEADA